MSKPIYLYITPFFPSPKTWQGGFCMDAVKALQADGRYEVVVMSAEDWGGDYQINGVRVFHIPRRKFGASEYFEWFLCKYNNRLFLNKIREIGLDLSEIAVCHVHDYNHYIQYALAIKKHNPRCLTLVHHHYAGYYDLKIGNLGVLPVWSDLLYCKMRREFAAVDAHIFISEHCRNCYGRRIDFDTGEDKGLLKDQLLLGRLYSTVEMKDSYVLYNGVDKSIFHPREEPGVRNEFVVGCVGNFNPCKCQMDLIKAFEIVVRKERSAKLRLLGNGKTYKECEDYVASHGIRDNVEFIKPIPHDKLPEFYRSLDLLVTPSVNEGFCCVNAEANYCGTPVVAIKGMPIEEILSRSDCEKWLVAPHDIEGLADKILFFASRPEAQLFTVDLDSSRLIKKFVDWTFDVYGT